MVNMEKKLIIFLIAFVVVVSAISIFSYTKKLPLSSLPEPGPSNKEYLVQFKICEGLSEEDCFANDNCIGIYGPSHCSPEGVCTTNMVFKSCSASGLNSDEIQKIKTECDKINGEFRKDRFGGYECLCKKPDYIGKDRCLQDLINQLKSN